MINVISTLKFIVRILLILLYTTSNNLQAQQTTNNPIIRSEIYRGEIYDARLAEHAVSASCLSAFEISYRSRNGQTLQQLLPLEITDTLHPVSITSPAVDTYILDMGQNMVGKMLFKVNGIAGTIVTLEHGELPRCA